MAKNNNSPVMILTESIGLYFSNFTKFIHYMTFPVLGQIGGLLLVFLITFIYTKNLPPLIEKFEQFNNFNILILMSIIITLPGLAIFCKSFWEYLVAYGALNSMYENMQKSGRVYDFNAHTELIKRRTAAFLMLWFLFGVFSFVALCPLCWIICGILAVYFVLVFQVFTFEPELSPIGCVKRSLELVKGHFASTFMLMFFIGAITYLIIPQLIIKVFDFVGINQIFANLILPLIGQISMPEFEQFGLKSPADFDIASFFIKTFIAQIIIQYTLPIRAILWSQWYNELKKGAPALSKQTTKKRPSEKLMEESHRKYGKKKLDKNILKRASEKDEGI